ncbi:TetR/AcrR family transcriptional regulator [Puniceicoccaceae bacterium K14]|nr:TetR/AcrR family transcriptional regulator [Puniceicoccaceae bacterium K14]
MTETQIKIIEAAEVEFAKNGFNGASIRDITSAAGVNVAAINYHFGNKDDLVREVVRYRIEPINLTRIQLLQDEYAKRKGNAIPLKRVIEIIIRPLFEALMSESCDDFHFMKVMAKGLGEENSVLQSLHDDILKDVISRFSKAIGHSLGTEDPRTIGYCMHLISSSVLGSMMQHKRLKLSSQGTADLEDVEGLIAHVVTFITGGIKAVSVMNR